MLPVISNLYEFIFNNNRQSTSAEVASEDAQMQSNSRDSQSLYGYKVMVHPKMEKSHFLKQRSVLLFGNSASQPQPSAIDAAMGNEVELTPVQR